MEEKIRIVLKGTDGGRVVPTGMYEPKFVLQVVEDDPGDREIAIDRRYETPATRR